MQTIRPTFGPVATFKAIIRPKGKTRAERKAARNAAFIQHPVSTGVMRVITYTPPGHYGKGV
jgi:hypothetical protein